MYYEFVGYPPSGDVVSDAVLIPSVVLGYFIHAKNVGRSKKRYAAFQCLLLRVYGASSERIAAIEQSYGVNWRDVSAAIRYLEAKQVATVERTDDMTRITLDMRYVPK